MTSLFAFFVFLLAALTGHAEAVPAPAPAVVQHEAGAGTVPSRQVLDRVKSTGARAVPRVTAPEVSAPAVISHPATVSPPADVAEQLPEEVIGRAITCTDGETGYVIDAALNTNCLLPPAQRTNPTAR